MYYVLATRVVYDDGNDNDTTNVVRRKRSLQLTATTKVL